VKKFMTELLEFIIKNLVDKPDEVKIKEIVGERATILEVSVATDDMGKIIGKQGRIAKAIRAIVKSAFDIKGQRVMVEIVENIENIENL